MELHLRLLPRPQRPYRHDHRCGPALHLCLESADGEKKEKLTMYCAIVVPYRVRIMIPETEMWEEGEERPDYVLQKYGRCKDRLHYHQGRA